jgi:hypothetical protein
VPIVAEEYAFLTGVGTQAAAHLLALITAATGAVVDVFGVPVYAGWA